MRPRTLLIVLVGIVGFLLAGDCSSGFALSNSGIRSLVGVKNVRVIAEDLTEAMQKTGLRKEQIAGTAAEALQKNGFTVLSPQDAGKVPLVYVRLSSVFASEKGTGPISFYLTLQVKQPATLIHEKPMVPSLSPATPEDAPLLVTTWEGGTMAMVNSEELFFYVKQILLNLVGDLARDQQEANTKQLSRTQ
jgi:hypothetical protein